MFLFTLEYIFHKRTNKLEEEKTDMFLFLHVHANGMEQIKPLSNKKAKYDICIIRPQSIV